MRKCAIIGGSVIVLSSVYFLGIKTSIDLIKFSLPSILMDKVFPEMALESVEDFINAIDKYCESKE